MTEEQQAERLAKWLEDPASDPPEDLDPELLGAIYTLSPKMAPAPRVTLEEILAEPRKDRVRTVAAPVERPAARAPTRMRRWMPALGVALAAALVALVVVPGSYFAGKSMSEAPMPEMAATAPRKMERSDTGTAPKAPPPSPVSAPPTSPLPPQTSAGAVPSASAPAPANSASGFANTGVESAKPVADAPSTETLQPTTPPMAPAEEAPAIPQPPPPPAQMVASEPAMGASAGPSPMAPRAPVANYDEKKQVRNLEEQEAGDDAILEAPIAEAERAEDQRERAASKTSTDVTSTISPYPLDYSANWYASYADVAKVYQEGRARESSGGWAAAAVIYYPLVSDSRTIVAQDAAWYCANAWWRAGQTSTALEVIGKGISRSTANTPYLARLYALKGDILSAQGQTAKAQAAYQQAISLNRGR